LVGAFHKSGLSGSMEVGEKRAGKVAAEPVLSSGYPLPVSHISARNVVRPPLRGCAGERGCGARSGLVARASCPSGLARQRNTPSNSTSDQPYSLFGFKLLSVARQQIFPSLSLKRA
jgi:hypothetical protein